MTILNRVRILLKDAEDTENTGGGSAAAPGSMEIDVAEPDAEADEDDDESASPARESGTERTPRQERRARRPRQDYRALEEQARQANERAQRLEQEIARIGGFLQAQQQPQQHDPMQQLNQELEQLNQEQRDIFEQARSGASLTAEQYDRLNRKSTEIERKKSRVMYQMNDLEMRGSRPDPRHQTQEQVFQAQLDREFPDFVGKPREGQLGVAIFRQLVLEGKPNNWDTLHEAAEEARRRLGWPTRSARPVSAAPTQQERQRLIADPKGGGGGGGEKPTKVRLTKEQLSMAEAWNPTLAKQNPTACYQKWWNEIGKKHA